MVPGQRFDKPGKSPFMDMQLVPVYADHAGDQATVAISPRVQQNLGMRTAQVVMGKLTSTLVAVGNVAYNERDVALVQARSDGFVERLHVRAAFDHVKRGQPLLELYVPAWIAAQEEYLAARRMRGIDGLGDAARQRMRLAGMDEMQIRQVEKTGKVQPRTTLFAPATGVITELAAREGMTVMAGTPLFRINGTGTAWINAEVPEALAAGVRAGTRVEASAPALPGAIFTGKVSAILPEVNAATRTLKARVELANPDGQLVPGMFANLSFATPSAHEALLVPSEALIRTGTRSIVIVAQGEGGFVPVEVETGAEANGQTEIRKGLEAGQKVVVSGQFLIDSEASLKGTLARMGDTREPQPGKPAATLHRAQGKVEHIGKGELTISHGPVATLNWPSMTMDFKAPAGGLPPDVAVGDDVSFDFVQGKDGSFGIVTIVPARQAEVAR